MVELALVRLELAALLTHVEEGAGALAVDLGAEVVVERGADLGQVPRVALLPVLGLVGHRPPGEAARLVDDRELRAAVASAVAVAARSAAASAALTLSRWLPIFMIATASDSSNRRRNSAAGKGAGNTVNTSLRAANGAPSAAALAVSDDIPGVTSTG